MRQNFLNTDEGRLRAGWRIALFLLLFVLLNLGLQLAFKAANDGIPDASKYVNSSALFVMVAIAATIAVFVARRFLDRKSMASLGLRRDGHTGRDIFFGFLLSGSMAAAFFLIVWAMGYADVTAISWSNRPFDASSWQALSRSFATMGLATLSVFLLIDLIVSWWEELVFRGYLYRNLKDGLGFKIAAISVCLVFAAIHLTNPNATLLSFFIILVFAIIRLAGVVFTDAIWLTFGMHAGWNFFQGPVFGFHVSGNEMSSIIELAISGPDWLSGGKFGPEGSILILPILAATLWIMRWWTKDRPGQPIEG